MKNHRLIDGKLLQTNKKFSQLKQKQKEWINEKLYLEFTRSSHGLDDEILNKVYSKVEEKDIWIPYSEIKHYYQTRKNKFKKRLEKEQARGNKTDNRYTK